MLTHIQHGLAPVGTVTPFGTIEQVSYTAYLISGTWVPFTVVHGPYGSVAPLISLA